MTGQRLRNVCQAHAFDTALALFARHSRAGQPKAGREGTSAASNPCPKTFGFEDIKRFRLAAGHVLCWHKESNQRKCLCDQSSLAKRVV
jgi:hypothetical protein